MSWWTLVWCLNKHNTDIDIYIDIDYTIEDDQGAWVLSSVYFPLADINTPQLFFKIYKIQSSCKYRWMQRYNFKFRQHIAGIHYPIHKTKDETHLCYLMWAQRQKIHYFHSEMWGCTKWRCGDAPNEMWRTGDAQGASCVNFLPNSQAVFLIVLVLYLLCTCISHWQKIDKHSQQILFISITSLNLLSSWTQRSSLKCVQDMSPGSVQDLKVLSHFLCSIRLPFITLTAVRQR